MKPSNRKNLRIFFTAFSITVILLILAIVMVLLLADVSTLASGSYDKPLLEIQPDLTLSASAFGKIYTFDLNPINDAAGLYHDAFFALPAPLKAAGYLYQLFADCIYAVIR